MYGNPYEDDYVESEYIDFDVDVRDLDIETDEESYVECLEGLDLKDKDVGLMWGYDSPKDPNSDDYAEYVHLAIGEYINDRYKNEFKPDSKYRFNGKFNVVWELYGISVDDMSVIGDFRSVWYCRIEEFSCMGSTLAKL